MENIIQQIAVKYITQVTEFLQERGIVSIGQAAQQLHSLTKAVTLEILSASLEQMDLALVAANKARKEDGLRIKERDVPRTLLTELGELQYARTYFEDKTGERRYLLDHLIGVSPYERLSQELCAALVQETAGTSMEKAVRRLDVPVSRQTVNNRVLALNEVCIDAVPAKETPSELHVFADEDHVHMKDGRSAVVPLVTVTEGVDVGKKRHKAIHPVHFEGFGMDPQDFFEGITSFLHVQYDMSRIKRIYVHADGGKWIAAAQDWLPNVRFVMDGFHLEKRLRQLSRLPGAARRMEAIRKAIREDAFDRFVEQCAKIDENLDKTTHDSLAKHVNFIQNHWDAIVLRLQNSVCGSCTEPLVSHVLSERLSRNPLAWSEHGLRQMAMLRVYVKNGGVVTAKDVRVSRSRAALETNVKARVGGYAKYRKLADEQVRDFLHTKCDWSLFAPSPPRSGKLDATGILKKAFASLRDNLAAS
jgi:hypothetical protein